MAKIDFKTFKEADLKNNCPLCFNQNLTLSYAQKHKDSAFFHKISAEIRTVLHCNTCNNDIFPVKWTDDIERSVNYYDKLAQPLKARTRFKPLFYVLFFLLIALIATGVYLYLEGIIEV